MLRLLIAAFILASCIMTYPLCATAGTNDPTLLHLKNAELLVNELQPDHNTYAYRPIYIRWKGQDGAEDYESHCDCSGFLTLLLEHTYGYTTVDFEKWMGHRRPLAHIYHDQIESAHGFTRIRLIDHIQPGDILAVKYLDPTKDTGHIMIVVDAPRLRPSTAPLKTGTQQWDVEVIDSAMSGHGPQDTRRKPDGSFNTGLGRGLIRLYSGENGELVGYTWSTLRVSKLYEDDTRPMVIGRLQPGFQP